MSSFQRKNPSSISIFQVCIHGTVSIRGLQLPPPPPPLPTWGQPTITSWWGVISSHFFSPLPNMNWIIWQLKDKGKSPGYPCLVSILKSYIMLYFTLWNLITFMLPVYEIWKALCSPKKPSRGDSCYFNCWKDISKNV